MGVFVKQTYEALKGEMSPIRKDIISGAKKILRGTRGENIPARQQLIAMVR